MNDLNAPNPPADDWRGLLLHRLSAEEAARLEQRLLADDDALAELRDAETDLHDDYARLQLTAAETAAFREHLLGTPAAQARQRFSQAMKPLPPEVRTRTRFQPLPRQRSRRGLWTALTGGAIAAGLAIAIVLFQRGALPGVPAPTLAEDPAAAPTLVLLASVERKAGQPDVNLVLRGTAGKLRVQAEVEHAEEARLYRIRLLGEDGEAKPLLDIEGLPLQTLGRYRFIEALLPSRLLIGGPRVLRIDSLPPAGEFHYEWTLSARLSDEPGYALPEP